MRAGAIVLGLFIFSVCMAVIWPKADEPPAPITYTDESELPSYDGTVELGKAHPHIIIAGNKLDYHEDAEWFFYAGTDVKAMWMEVGPGLERELGIVPHRYLMTTQRRSAASRCG